MSHRNFLNNDSGPSITRKAAIYRLMGDERRAAEQEANAAGLLIDYGNQEEGRRRLNARATLDIREH